MAMIAKKMKLLKGVRKFIKTNPSSRAVYADVYRCYVDTLDSYMLARVGQIAVEVRTHAVHE